MKSPKEWIKEKLWRLIGFLVFIVVLIVLVIVVAAILSVVGFGQDTPPGGWSSVIPPITSPQAFAQCEYQSSGNFLNNMANFIITPITEQVSLVSEIMFENLVGNLTFRGTVTVVLVLYIALYGMYVAIGFTQIKFSNLLMRCLKIGVVLALFQQNSWHFFSRNFLNLFNEGNLELISIVTAPNCDISQINYFSFVDYIVNSFLESGNIALRFSAWLTAFPIGWLCASILAWTILYYILAILKAIIAYLIAYTAVGLMIGLAPLFFILLLFDGTKNIFMDWVKSLVSFAMEPVVLFAFIAFVSMMINQALYNAMGPMAWSPFLDFYVNFDIGTPCSDTDWCLRIAHMHWYSPCLGACKIGHENTQGYTNCGPFQFYNLQAYAEYFVNFILLGSLVSLLNKSGKIAATISSYLFGGAGMIGAAESVVSGVGQSALSVVGLDKASQAKRQEKAGEKQGVADKAKRREQWGGKAK